MPDTQAPAADRTAPPEVITVDDPVVACDGGGGALGHPRVFLRIVAGDILCPYCSRHYVLNQRAHHAAAH